MKNTLVIIVSATIHFAKAQTPSTGIWTAVQVPVKLNKNWQWHNDGGFRTIGISSSVYQYLYRTGGRYFLNKQWSIAAGTAFFFTRSSYQKTDHAFGKEFRLWQEVNFNHPLNTSFSVQNRVRTEERWFDAVQNKKAYYAFRFRYRISGTKMFSHKWGIQLAEEYMQQSVNRKFTFNQNRLIATTIFNPTASAQVHVGYMWLLWPSASQHIATITFQKSLSIHENKKRSN